MERIPQERKKEIDSRGKREPAEQEIVFACA
jgi:hypothetical protein